MGDNKITLKVSERTVHGKKVKSLRREGVVPVVVYGPGMEPMSAQVSYNELAKVVKAAGKHTPVHVTLGEKKRIVMVKEISMNPSKNRIDHVAFHAVRQNKPIEAEVPIRLVGEGESEAEKSGLIILQNIDSIEVKALPLEMPDALEIDIRHLKEAGEKVLIGDIKLPENVELVEHDDGHDEDDEEEKQSILDLQVASVWEPSALQAANEAAAGDAEDESEVESEQGAEAAPAEGDAEAAEAKE